MPNLKYGKRSISEPNLMIDGFYLFFDEKLEKYVWLVYILFKLFKRMQRILFFFKKYSTFYVT